MKRTVCSLFSIAAVVMWSGGCNQPATDAPKAGSTPSAAQKAPAPASGASSESENDAQFFRTPGGKYTAEDIRANGDLPPAQKYKEVGHARSGKPVAGDKLCPISKGKANPDVTWVVGGKTYAFCCPPCIEDFVKLAKEKPDEVKDPASYVKQ